MKSKTDIEIAEKVKKMRIRLDISQRMLAEIIETTHSFPNQVENMKSPSKYSAHQLYLIAKYFGCSVADLYPPINPLDP